MYDIPIFEVGDLRSFLRKSVCVRGYGIALVGSFTEYERTSVSYRYEISWFFFIHHEDCVSSFESLYCMFDSLEERSPGISGDEMSYDLRIGITSHLYSIFLELGSKLPIVFDDTVMYHKKSPSCIRVRVSIFHSNSSMSRPPSMSHPDRVFLERITGLFYRSGELTDSANRPKIIDLFSIVYGETSTIISTILQFSQSLEYDTIRIRTTTKVSKYATHS